MHVKDSYTMFCSCCGWSRPIPDEVMKSTIIVASHVQCVNCEEFNKIPQALQYVAMDMKGEGE